ncbi:hypothetical protein L3X38_021143 [Prunus dulcis]|uniref:S-locus lectin protein kinase family protein n=1 Tax=Prunus dulcis TaxID=3755 RepID=A0AAD4VVD8_PRUDU|nr:hypothetical protein L3X38_021143 [Prunus dulcis]
MFMKCTKGLTITPLVQFVLLIRCCNSIDSITTDQAIRDGEVLVSNGEVFELGFFRPGKSTNHYVGIWYKKDVEKTVVWVANRDNPINDTSGVLSIGAHGNCSHRNLILYARNQTNIPVWSTKSNVSISSSSTPDPKYKAQLLDTGNLVLVEQDSQKVTWLSFDYPTDTILPHMKLGLDKRTGFSWFLTSWKSEDDPGTGNYTYAIDPNGAPQIIFYNGNVRYWRTGNWNGIRWWWGDIPVVLDTNIFNASYVNNQDEIIVTWGVLNSSISTRIVAAHLGSIEQFNWYEQDLRWNNIWSGPRDRCDIYGRCGAFGYCDSESLRVFECKCLPGFQPKCQMNGT